MEQCFSLIVGNLNAGPEVLKTYLFILYYGTRSDADFLAHYPINSKNIKL